MQTCVKANVTLQPFAKVILGGEGTGVVIFGIGWGHSPRWRGKSPEWVEKQKWGDMATGGGRCFPRQHLA